ncbi:MAG TPA: DUF6603 domain-containing protein [Hymenobacter sp.]|jgi:hypothetical protein|uniref:DUF6603 domain-containing protein n=1 Tax=Hymenobacter sp. TaxID=1898978 RepID=UPI002ED84E74
MYTSNFQKILFVELKKLWQPLIAASTSREQLSDLFLSLGWDVEAFSSNGQEENGFLNAFQVLGSSLSILDTFSTQSAPNTLPELTQYLSEISEITDTVREATGAFSNQQQYFPFLVGDLIKKLFVKYLYDNHNEAYFLLKSINVIISDSSSPVIINGLLAYDPEKEESLDLIALSRFIRSPNAALASIYWPQGLNTVDQATESGNRLFKTLAGVFKKTTIEAVAGRSEIDKPDYIDTQTWERLRGLLTVQHRFIADNGIQTQLGITAGILSAFEGGPGVFLQMFGELAVQQFFGNWVLSGQIDGQLQAIKVTSKGIQPLSPSILSAFNSHIALNLLTPKEGGAALKIGSTYGTRLEIGHAELGAFIRKTNIDDYGIILRLSDSTFVIKPGDGDSFINKIIPLNGTNFKFDFGIGWTKSHGIHFEGSTGLEKQINVTHTSANRNFFSVKSFQLGITASNSGILVATSASGKIELGPVIISLDKVGLASNILFKPNGGNTGPADLNIQFDPPKAVGIQVESDAVTGGGYLTSDPANHQYAGVAQLILKTGKEINLTALGLLQTELPGKPNDYSLLLLITAQFGAIQLGLGFTLSGVGGVIGVNRATNTDYLRGLVHRGQIKQLLFPANVLDNPAAALAMVDSAFPATEGRYVIGLMAQVGWGVPTSLICLDVALIVELPAPVRLAILGVLQATLPDKDRQFLKLRADFLGTVDFGSRRAAFDATLSDSKILNFILNGDLAFRLYQGQNPLFLISAGGYHPDFKAPAGAGYPSLRRLTLSLATGNDLRITLASYFAVTSNTVQFGSSLDLYLRLRLGLYVDGHFGFDILFQFNPFRLAAYIDARVAIKRGSTTLLGLRLSLNVTGPGPWHIWGEASFKIWLVRISVRVNTKFGTEASQDKLPSPNVHDLLYAALTTPTSWEVEAPATAVPAGIVLRPLTSQPSQLFLDPRGALVLRQRVAPLGLALEKYGNGTALPTGGSRFDLTTLKVGKLNLATTGATATDLETVRDFFAPEQFRRFSDGEKLSLPSFELLPCGLRVKSLAGLVGAAIATQRIVEYEQLVLNGPATGVVTGGTIGKLSPRTFQNLARNSQLGKEYQAAQPSARAPQPVGWSEQTYSVVKSADLSLYDPEEHPSFASQVQAEDFRRLQVDAPELLVIPSYELLLA